MRRVGQHKYTGGSRWVYAGRVRALSQNFLVCACWRSVVVSRSRISNLPPAARGNTAVFTSAFPLRLADGEIKISLAWFNVNDLDICPWGPPEGILRPRPLRSAV